MKHKDGIECYLKARGASYDERKFAEIPQDVDNDNDHRMHSVVLKTRNKFNVVLKFSDTFDMSSASLMHMLVALKAASGQRHLFNCILTKRSVSSGVATVWSKKDFGFTFTGWATESSIIAKARTFANYNLDPARCDMLISVQRGHGVWTDATKRKHPEDPEEWDQIRGGSFAPLSGEMGAAYVFRFTPQSRVTYGKTVQKCRLPLARPVSTRTLAFAADPGFRADVNRAAAFRKRVKEKGGTTDQTILSSDSGALVSSEAASTLRCDAPSDGTVQGVSSSTSLPSDKAAESRPSTSIQICSCPKVHRTSTKQVKTNKFIPQYGGKASTSMREWPDDLAQDESPSPAGDTPPTHLTARHDGDALETAAKQCTSCKKFKAPPSGKKITYRRSRGRYMCVPRNAPNEVGPADTVLRRTVSETDSPARPTSEPDLPLADGIDADAASVAAPSSTSEEHEISQSEITQVVSEEPAAQPPNSSTPVTAKTPGSQADETSLDEPSITSTNPITVVGTEATKQPASNKRPVEPSNEQPPAKQPRIEESTIPHNENQSVSIKTEPEADTDIQFVTTQDASKTRREKRLEEEIARTQRELRQIELEKKMEELQRQLAAEQRRKQNATPMIQVKQEIIELD
ncbi:hypothetical protein CKM354_000007200 [Cercospora kikuchii]|uniref:Uncharacterized protein n=1 Tax=Cercospora kikuchii TaxID=84275 RepID=A0A9P3FAP4_9PEZI|nr:uncharacterized protein CKM354_000007200 [Cercospora kikuchii]GIZ36602.1 hypothetical protein CKM354_000007200 [Cercospora kikuchii]